MAKIERKFMAHYINAAAPGEEAVYERLGTDLEEYSPNLGARVQSRLNILGQQNVIISGYRKTAAVEPYYAEKGSALYERLQQIVDDGLVMENLKTDVVEVRLWKNENGSCEAVKEEAYIEVVSYGGDTTGYQIPFKLHFTGVKSYGSYNTTDGTFG